MRVLLQHAAHTRSGDKGNTANVGLIALEPEYYPILLREVTRARVARHFKGMVSGVERFELPNLHALNFLLHDALDAFVNEDAPKAQAVIERDRIVDAYYAQLYPAQVA